MTVLEMINSFNIGVDKTTSFQTVSFEEEEVLYWLNEAQLQVIKQKMFGNNFRKEGFDTLYKGKVTKRSDDLSNLIRNTERLNYYPTGNPSAIYPHFRPHEYHPNVATINIVADNMPRYLFYIDTYFKAVGQDGPMETEVIEQKDIRDFVETPTNKPFLRNGLVYLKGNEVNIIHDPFVTPEWAYISYVMQPKKLALFTNPDAWITDYSIKSHWDDEVVSQGLVSEQIHPEIVSLAVNLALENVADPRYQSHSIELNKKE